MISFETSTFKEWYGYRCINYISDKYFYKDIKVLAELMRDDYDKFCGIFTDCEFREFVEADLEGFDWEKCEEESEWLPF